MPPDVVAVPLQLVGARDSLLYGDTLRLGIAADTVTPDTSAAARVVVWTSSDTLTARVDSTGLVTSVGAGPVTITATRGTRAGSRTVATHFATFARGRSWRSVKTDYFIACALADDGAAFCMGNNRVGQLGTMDGVEPCGNVGGCSYDMLPVDGGRRYTSIDLGYGHVCALAVGGEAYCWGRNSKGELGTGVLPTGVTTVPTPVLAANGTRFQTLAASGHGQSCGSRVADSVMLCWGHNDNLQIGRYPRIGGGDPNALPVDSVGKLVHVATDDFHTCALTAEGAAWCWGDVIAAAGTSDPVYRSRGVTTPFPVETSLRFTQLATGLYATCGLTTAGEVHCWGYSTLLDRATNGSVVETPRRMFSGKQFASIAVGTYDLCGITSDGRLFCTPGASLAARGTAGDALLPIAPSLRFKAVALSHSSSSTCAITVAGALHCWGRDIPRRP